MILSIIVPVYNVQDYILDFIQSIVPQMTSEVELIIVDDETPDESIAIINNYIHEFGMVNVKYIKQLNQGLSGARNSGVRESQGSFISFVDPDDILIDGYINVVLDNIKNKDFDILTFNANRVDMKGQYLSECTVCTASDNRDECLIDIFNRGRWYAWARVYKKELLGDAPFPVGKRFEDLLTVPDLYIKATKLVNIDDVLLSYRVNPSGITNNPKENDVSDVKEFTDYNLSRIDSTFDSSKALVTAIYISSVRTLFYLTNDLYGPLRSFLFMRKYYFYNLKMSRVEVSFFNRNNTIFIRFILAHYLYYNLKKWFS